MISDTAAYVTISDRTPLWPSNGVRHLCTVVVDGGYELRTAQGRVVDVGRGSRVFGAAELLYGAAPLLHARALGPVILRFTDIATLAATTAHSRAGESALDEALRLEREALGAALTLENATGFDRIVHLFRLYARTCGASRDDGWVKLRIARTQREIGDACGLTVRHTARMLRELEEKGCFRLSKGWCFVHERLVNHAASSADDVQHGGLAPFARDPRAADTGDRSTLIDGPRGD